MSEEIASTPALPWHGLAVVNLHEPRPRFSATTAVITRPIRRTLPSPPLAKHEEIEKGAATNTTAPGHRAAAISFSSPHSTQQRLLLSHRRWMRRSCCRCPRIRPAKISAVPTTIRHRPIGHENLQTFACSAGPRSGLRACSCK